jgi:CheY-like chemotaxis protein
MIPPSRSSSTRVRATRQARILVIDDDLFVADAIALELSEHMCVIASNGQHALQLLEREGPFDVLLCDVMMPVMSGPELHKHLERTNPTLASRMIFMSGATFGVNTGRFMRVVPNPCLEKPFDFELLRSMILHLLNESDATQEMK